MLKRIIKVLIVVLTELLLLSSLASCSQDGVPDGYQLVACEGDEFRLYVPAGWKASTMGGITSAIYSMDDNVTVSVYVADDAKDLTAEDYWKLCDQRFKEEFDGYSSSDKTEKTVLGGKSALKCVYSAKRTTVNYADGSTSQVEYKYMQIMARHKDKMYVLLYSAPANKYDAHISEIEGNSEGVGVVPYFVFAEAYHSDDNNKEYSSDVTVPEGMKLISTDERAYRLFVPTAWKVNVRTEASAAYVDEADGTRTNVSAQMYMTGDESQTVEQYWTLCEQSYKKLFDSYTLVSSEGITVDGAKAGKYVYDVTTGGNNYRQMQVIVKKGAMFYVITYTASPEFFDAHIAEVQKMIDSFDIR
ncbi:MAG: DUF1795 domain-containing protein [Ruminococcaceae bacterium]|nr:DUF1795 domain-containing protein [Oscillospiraceae bacterium]